MIMTGDEAFALMCTRPEAVRNFGLCSFELGVERGREEGAMWMAAYIALGTWAAERAEEHRFWDED